MRGPRNVFSESVTVVTSARIIEGGVVGHDTIKSTNRVVRVIVDRRRAWAGNNGFWDSATGPLPEDWQHQGHAIISGLSYDLVMSPDFTTYVANWHAPGEALVPPSIYIRDDAYVDDVIRTLDQDGIITEFSLAFRIVPKGRHSTGSNWTEKTRIGGQPLYRAESATDGIGAGLIARSHSQSRIATNVDWSLRSFGKGVAQLRFTAEVIQLYGEPANQFGQLRYDVAAKRPVERSISTIEERGANRNRIQTTRKVRYRID